MDFSLKTTGKKNNMKNIRTHGKTEKGRIKQHTNLTKLFKQRNEEIILYVIIINEISYKLLKIP